MRIILSGLLIVLIFAATLMCFCAPGAQAGISQGHTHAGHHESQGSQDHHGKGKGDADCKGADMQLPQQAGVSSPDHKSALYLDFAFASHILARPFFIVSDNAIRGPPPDWPRHSQSLPSILLTTQRLRI